MLLQKNSMVVNKYANSLLFRKAFTHTVIAMHRYNSNLPESGFIHILAHIPVQIRPLQRLQYPDIFHFIEPLRVTGRAVCSSNIKNGPLGKSQCNGLTGSSYHFE